MHRGKTEIRFQNPSRTAFGKGKTTVAIKKSGDAPARLRFQNKKPLCLQYHLPNGSSSSKLQFRRAKRSSSSLYHNFVRKLIIFCKWMLKTTQAQIFDFLLKPAPCAISTVGYGSIETTAEYTNYSRNRSTQKILCRFSTQKQCYKNVLKQNTSPSSRKYALKRDFGRSARLSRQTDRFAELCIF